MKYPLLASMLLSLWPVLSGIDEARATDPVANPPGAFRAEGPLDAGELKGIQQVSRSVLTAKRRYAPDADQTALRDELNGLLAAIEAALAPQAGANVILRDAADSSTETSSTKVSADDRYGALRARLATVHDRRQKIENKARRAKPDPGKPQTANLTTKVAELEAETDAALNAEGGERISRLRALRARLQAKSRRETLDERTEKSAEAAGKTASGKASAMPSRMTPSISTLVHHR